MLVSGLLAERPEICGPESFASSFVFVTVISRYVLKERMRITRIAGVLLIVLWYHNDCNDTLRMVE